MPLEELLKMIRAQPFVPFRLHLTDGSTFDVRHPELVMAGARTVHVGIALDPNQIHFDSWEIVALIHIARLEPLGLATPSANNGQQD